jgi:hypothetical protein
VAGPVRRRADEEKETVRCTARIPPCGENLGSFFIRAVICCNAAKMRRGDSRPAEGLETRAATAQRTMTPGVSPSGQGRLLITVLSQVRILPPPPPAPLFLQTCAAAAICPIFRELAARTLIFRGLAERLRGVHGRLQSIFKRSGNRFAQRKCEKRKREHPISFGRIGKCSDPRRGTLPDRPIVKYTASFIEVKLPAPGMT